MPAPGRWKQERLAPLATPKSLEFLPHLVQGALHFFYVTRHLVEAALKVLGMLPRFGIGALETLAFPLTRTLTLSLPRLTISVTFAHTKFPLADCLRDAAL